MRLRLNLIYIGTLLILLPAPAAFAGQRTASASLSGRASDTSGASLPGVVVTLSSEVREREPRTTVTDEEGRYEFRSLSSGRYRIAAELSGFRTDRKDIRLHVGNQQRVDFVLRIGGVTESVTVTGERAGRSLRDTAASVAVLDAQTIERLPRLDLATELLTTVPNVGGMPSRAR